MLNNQKILAKKSSFTAEFKVIYQKIHNKNNGNKNQNKILKTLFDFKSECKKANNHQKIGIIKEKNPKTKSLFHTKNSSHHHLVQPEISNNFIWKLNTKKSRNHIIIPK